MKFGPRRHVEPEINVTSLIDVVLLLVMFFMVSTTFQQDSRLKVHLPESSARPEARAVDAVTILVTADGAYRVNDRALVNRSPETLRAALEKVAGPGVHTQALTIRADARATHQAVVTAMDIAGRVGFAQVNIATINQQPGG
ncbi:MAG TPA: biopolymer transporter ExbD [Steroidobacteraceae bacterium]|nr:biopolymer transporter ExbD [Steroidobacteraceae bacterium]